MIKWVRQLCFLRNMIYAACIKITYLFISIMHIYNHFRSFLLTLSTTFPVSYFTWDMNKYIFLLFATHRHRTVILPTCTNIINTFKHTVRCILLNCVSVSVKVLQHSSGYVPCDSLFNFIMSMEEQRVSYNYDIVI